MGQDSIYRLENFGGCHNLRPYTFPFNTSQQVNETKANSMLLPAHYGYFRLRFYPLYVSFLSHVWYYCGYGVTCNTNRSHGHGGRGGAA